MTRWLAAHDVGSVVQFRIGADGPDLLVAEWIGVARLIARRNGGLVGFEPEPNADPRTIAKIERGAAGMLMRHLRGGLSVHGAAIAFKGRAALILGVSGMGKSTLAAWLVEKASASLLSDDLTPLELDADGRWCALPLESDHWLDAAALAALGAERDSNGRAAKQPRETARFSNHAAPIAVIIDLAFGSVDAVEVSRINAMDGLGLLLRNSVRFEIDNFAAQKRELDLLASMVGDVPFVRMTRPRSFEALAPTADHIAGWLREGMVDL